MSYFDRYKKVNVLEGKVLTNIYNNDNEELIFYADEGTRYKMYHEQDCCEHVRLEEVIGDLQDLIGEPILQATESSQVGEDDDYGTSTWTFYTIATIKGSVTLRWLGESNGYYSESVDFVELDDND